MTQPRIVLIGPPGSGKSTVGRELATRLGVTLRDTDDDVAARAGKPIPDIFLDDGEAAFRLLEREAVAEALAGDEAVVSLGGGAVLDASTQQRLADFAANGGTVVFLDVSVTAAAPRVGFNRSRPLLVGNPRQQWKALMDARRPIYEGLATVAVVTDGLGPGDVAQRILEQEQ